MLWSLGRRIAELIPFHHQQVNAMAAEIQKRSEANLAHLHRIEALEAQLRDTAEARTRAEDRARFIESQLTAAQSQLADVTARLLATHERTTDFLALATSAGRRTIHAPAPPAVLTEADRDAANQPLTTGRMRASDARAVMTKLSVTEDQRRQDQAREYAKMLRQQAAADRDQNADVGDSEPSEPVVSIRSRMSPEEQKAAADIAAVFEKEIMSDAG